MGKLFLVACVLDTIFQLFVLHWVYPVQTVIVAIRLAILPYRVFRGLADRFGRRSGSNNPNSKESAKS